jgi:hypothetical protein
MSADSYNALEHAITGHVFDELEQEITMVTDWVVIAAVVHVDDADENEAHIVIHSSADTPLYSTLGLIEVAKRSIG